MTKAIQTTAVRFHKTGGPEVLVVEKVEVPPPGPGKVRLGQRAAGVNFIDTYHRSGLYSVPELPSGLGVEAVGVVEALGEGVRDFEVGDRVGYVLPIPGAYARHRNVPADRLIRLPDDLPDEVAAGILVRGMTAELLVRRVTEVGLGSTVLIHAAAGGVGLPLGHWAKHLGATVLGTVGSEEKAELIRAHGIDHPIVYTREDFVARAKELTGGRGVDVVYDSVGKDTFERSLVCLRRRGLCVTFGQSSGPIPPFEVQRLGPLGSLFLTRPSLFHYITTREELEASARAVFEGVGSGALKVKVDHTYPLEEVRQAHDDLEKRRTQGSVVLTA